MLDIGADSREMMTMFKDFRVVHVICLWIYVLFGILREPTILVEFGKESTY
jgi:hypothetical protein